jgi:AbrB family looped-hinge helix DNA binding protein
MSLEEHFYGAATVGERGQVVIPAEARKKFGIHPGDKVLVMGHPTGGGVVLCKLDAMREFASTFMDDLERIETKIAESDDTSGGE